MSSVKNRFVQTPGNKDEPNPPRPFQRFYGFLLLFLVVFSILGVVGAALRAHISILP
jgi:hypothetical protein